MTARTLKDKVVVIAGGGKNLGALVAREFAQAGARAIAIHYNSASSQAAAEATLAEVKALGAEAVLFQADLSVVKNNAALFDAAVERFGQVDVAINTVGVVIKKAILDVTEDD